MRFLQVGSLATVALLSTIVSGQSTTPTATVSGQNVGTTPPTTAAVGAGSTVITTTTAAAASSAPLTVVQQQEVADETDYNVAGQTIDSQAPYYGWNVSHFFQPWDVPTDTATQPSSSVYGDTYKFSVSNINNTDGKSTTPLIDIYPASGSNIDYTPRNTTNTGTFSKIVVVFMENMEWSWTESDPNWQTISELGLTFTNYSGISHPSEPNYVAFWGGDFFGINNDAAFNVHATNLADLIEHAGYTWKMYQEEYVPLANGGCNNAGGIGNSDKGGTQLYQRKHNPAIIYDNISSNNTRCQNVVNEGQWAYDVLNNALPTVSFYTPNIVNDGHDVDNYGDARTTSSGWWVKQFLSNYLQDIQQQNALLLLTFDEADYPNTLVPYPTLYPVANQIPSILFGPTKMIKPNTTYAGYVNHYGVLDAIEQNFALGSLGRNDTVSNNGGQAFFNALKNISVIQGETYGALVGDSVVPVDAKTYPVGYLIGSEDLIPAV